MPIKAIPLAEAPGKPSSRPGTLGELLQLIGREGGEVLGKASKKYIATAELGE